MARTKTDEEIDNYADLYVERLTTDSKQRVKNGSALHLMSGYIPTDQHVKFVWKTVVGTAFDFSGILDDINIKIGPITGDDFSQLVNRIADKMALYYSINKPISSYEAYERAMSVV